MVFLGICSVTKAETPTINSRLPFEQDGPLTVSPWFTAAQSTDSAAKNHYIYATPLPLLYCGWYDLPCFYPTGSWRGYFYTRWGY